MRVIQKSPLVFWGLMISVFLSGLLVQGLLGRVGKSQDLPKSKKTESSDRDLLIHQNLNQLKTDVNLAFGFQNGHPRVDLGPCGSFAREFYESWNERFSESGSVQIAFIKILNGQYCRHVLIRLPSGLFFDGGLGVMTEAEVYKLYREVNGQIDPTISIEVMQGFDSALWEQNSVPPPYPDSPDYSQEIARQLIDHHLDELKAAL